MARNKGVIVSIIDVLLKTNTKGVDIMLKDLESGNFSVSVLVINITQTIIFTYPSGGHGDFVVHLSNNRMFYGRAFVGHVVEVLIYYSE